MIPPYSMQFTLWGSALWAEFAAGLWRALATPWLEPLPPARDQSQGGATGAAPRSAARGRSASAAVVGEPTSPERATGRVIAVPLARWPGPPRPQRGTAADR